MVKLTGAPGGGIASTAGGISASYDAAASNSLDWGTVTVAIRGGRLLCTIASVPENVVAGTLYVQGLDGATLRRAGFFFIPSSGQEIDLGAAPTAITGLPVWEAYVSPWTTDETGRLLIGTAIPGSEITVAPSGPGAVAFEIATGAASGQITIKLLSPLPSAGDGATAGDGLGVLTGVSYRIDDGSAVNFGSLTANHVVTVSALAPGAQVAVQMRGSSSSRDGGWGAAQTVLVKEIVGSPPVFLGKPATMQPIQATAFSLDVAPLFTGATSYALEGPGLTGGSMTGSVYSVASLTLETKTIAFRATNSFGSVLGDVDVQVRSAGVAPVWQAAAIPDAIVSVGGAIDVDLSQYITAGTTPITFSVPTNSYTEIVSGRYKSKVGVTASAVALTTQTLTASNGTSPNATKSIKFQVAARAAKLVLTTQVMIARSDYAFTGDTDWWKPVVKFPTNLDAAAGVSAVLWSTADPDANGNIDISLYETLNQTSTTPKEYKPVMMDGWRNGNPDDQTAAVDLPTDPITTVNASPTITVRVSSLAHLPEVGRRARLLGATATGGLTPAGYYTVVTADAASPQKSFTITLASDATSSAAGGGAAVTMVRNRVDYSCFGSSEVRSTNFRVARIVNGVVSEWSDPMSVPNVIEEPVTPTPTAGDTWLPYILRPSGTYPLVGSPGMQFQHCVAWNLGRNDAAKAGYCFFGQDENNFSFTPDHGATLNHLHMLGMPASKCSGVWANSDDNLILCLAGPGYGTGSGGLYVSKDWGKTASRRVNDFGTSWITEGGLMSVNQNLVDRRPQNAAGTLTNAQRPIYWVEQRLASSVRDGTITMVRVWRNKDNMAGNGSSDEMIYTFTTSAVSSGVYGMFWLKVAPNGDVVIAGQNGVWYSSNADGAGVTFTKRGGSTRVRGLAVFEGAGGKCGVYVATDGAILRSNDLEASAPAAVGGQNLPGGTYTMVACMASDPNRVFTTNSSNNGGAGTGYISTNSAGTFSAVTSNGQTGDNANRWQFGDRAAGIYPHPYDITKAIASTTQSMTRAKNSQTTFNGNDTAFWCKTHIKGGLGTHPTDPDQVSLMAQDRGPMFTYGRGMQDIQATYMSRKENVPNQAGVTKTLSQHVLDATNKTGGFADTGRGNFPYPNNANKHLSFWCQDGGAVTSAPVISTRSGNTWSSTRVFTNVGGSRIEKQFWSPVESNVLFAGRWTFSGWSATDTALNIGTQERGVLGYSQVGNVFETYWGAEGGVTSIYRSTENRGGGQTLWKSGVSSFDGLACAVNPGRLGHIVYAPKSGDGKIYDIQNGGTPRLIADTKALTQAIFTSKGITSTLPNSFGVWQLEAHPLAPSTFYAAIECCGVPSVWMITFNSSMVPTIVRYDTGLALTIGFVRIHPLTGDVFFFSSQGNFCMKSPPGTVTPTTAYKDRHYKWLTDYYARSDVPNPINTLIAA